MIATMQQRKLQSTRAGGEGKKSDEPWLEQTSFWAIDNPRKILYLRITAASERRGGLVQLLRTKAATYRPWILLLDQRLSKASLSRRSDERLDGKAMDELRSLTVSVQNGKMNYNQWTVIRMGGDQNGRWSEWTVTRMDGDQNRRNQIYVLLRKSALIRRALFYAGSLL